jgi:phytoene desaturase
VPRGLAAAAGGAGAELRFGVAVDRIERTAGGAVSGVRLAGGERLVADVVVANPDLPAVYRDLLGLEPPRRAARGRYSPSCLLWLAGARGRLPPGTAHHNVHFGAGWAEPFDELFGRGRPATPMTDPSILVSVPGGAGAADETAPPGGHALYVLEPVPNLDAAFDWDRLGPERRDRLAGQVAALGYPREVEVERWTDPPAWAAAGLERGTPFALAHHFRQSGPFRPANVDPAIAGLVLVGSATVPGVGVPMVLLSGRLAAERAEQAAAGRRGGRPLAGRGRRRRGGEWRWRRHPGPTRLVPEDRSPAPGTVG